MITTLGSYNTNAFLKQETAKINAIGVLRNAKANALSQYI